MFIKKLTLLKSILIFSFLFTSMHLAQNVIIKVDGLGNWQASLFSLGLEKTNFISTIISDKNGLFKIPEKKLKNGFYRLVFGKNNWLNFISDGNDVEIETNKKYLVGNLKVIKSNANKEYYKFLNFTSAYKIAQKKLQEAAQKHLQKDNELELIKKEFLTVYNNYWSFVNKFTKSDNESLISRYIRSAREPKIEPGLDIQSKIKYLKLHYWDNVDFSNALLLHSDLYANKTVEYLNLFKDSRLSKGSLEKEYQRAVDVILNKAKTNQRIYKGMTEYLINGFKKMGLRNVIDYIVDNFVIADDLCLDSQTDNFIQMRINQSKILKKNIKIRNIKLPDLNGKTVELYNVTADKILILFYSSQCPHCREFLPELLNLYNSKTFGKFEIYGISLDTDFDEWQSYVRNNNYNWINVSDLKGWESKVSYDFYIYATPTMFLVDKNFKIIDKPKNLNDLKSDLLNE